MKRFISLLSAAVMLTTAVSCSTTEEPSAVISVEKLVLKESEITLAEQFSRIISLEKSSGRVLVFGEISDGTLMGCITDRDFADFTSFKIVPRETEIVKSACIDKFGNSAVLSLVEGEAYIRTYNQNGELAKENAVGELFGESDGAFIKPAEDGYYININGQRIAAIGKDLAYIDDVDLKGGTIFGFSCDNENVPTVLLGGSEFETAHISGTSLVDVTTCSKLDSSAFSMCGGDDVYELYVNIPDGLYGLKNGNWEQLSDYMDNSFECYDICGIIAFGNDEFAIALNTADGARMKLLSKTDVGEIKARKLVTIACFGSGTVDEMTKIYNQDPENTEYKVEYVYYTYDDNHPYEEMMKQLKLDIISGKSPDIITSFIPGLDPSRYYYDLSEFMANDDELTADKFIPGFLDGITYKGTIPMLFPTFTVNTLIAKSKYTGGAENVSYDEFIDICNNMPEDMKFTEYSDQYKIEDMFSYLVYLDDFVDYDKAECHFDSPDFIKMLKFVKDEHIGLNDTEWNRLHGDDVLVFHEGDYLGVRDDRVMFAENFVGPWNMAEMLQAQLGGEDVSFVGHPSSSGQGGYINAPKRRYSIIKSAQCPEGAWDYIKYIFSHSPERYEGFFPTLEDEFKEAMAETMALTHYEDDSDEPVPNAIVHYGDTADNTIEYESLTAEQEARAEAYVRSCVTRFRWLDEGRSDIIKEELVDYFNSDRTAEECAKIIQNRVSIYLSEQS